MGFDRVILSPSQERRTRQPTATWLRVMVIILLGLGVLLRFSDLDLKPYWFDEASTSIQLAGQGDAIAQTTLLTGQVIGIADLQAFQYPSPDSNLASTIAGLAIKEPQLTPLYFVLARVWVQWFGDSVTVTRSLSAVFGVLIFPCLYWLCLELFQAPIVGWLAIGLTAVSPFHVLYAQEARPPGLWTCLILLSSVALLRALRLQTARSWAVYAVTIAVGLYTFLFTGVLVIAHGLYVLLSERWRFRKPLVAYSLSTVIGVLAFLPWVLFAMLPYQQAMAGQSKPTTIGQIFKAWVRNPSLLFIDFSLNESSPRLYFLLFLVLVGLTLLLIGYALYFLKRTAPRSAQWFIFSLVLVPFGLLTLSDLAAGASRTLVPRYLIPTYLGLQLAVAYLLADRLTANFKRPWQPIFWKVTTATVLTLGVLSSVVYLRSDYWWSKADANLDYELVRTHVNSVRQPLIVSDAYFVNALALSYALDSDTQFQLVPQGQPLAIAPGFDHRFLYRPSPALLNHLQPNYQLEPIHPERLWKLTPKSAAVPVAAAAAN